MLLFPRWKEICSTPLRNAIAMSIVEKYKDVPGDQLLLFISSHNYNENIKTILETAGITYLVTKLDSVTRRESKVPINEWPAAIWLAVPSSATSTNWSRIRTSYPLSPATPKAAEPSTATAILTSI